MIEISCYYIHTDDEPSFIVFIKYEKYFKVLLNSYRCIILSNDTFANIPNLNEYYLLSLFTTCKINDVELYNNKMIMMVKLDWKKIRYTDHYYDVAVNMKRDPFSSKEPKRETSNKKIKKFIKNFNRYFN